MDAFEEDLAAISSLARSLVSSHPSTADLLAGYVATCRGTLESLHDDFSVLEVIA